jgi:hypothetical protein
MHNLKEKIRYFEKEKNELFIKRVERKNESEKEIAILKEERNKVKSELAEN